MATLDALAREVTMLRAGHRCERCGAGERLQWHHVFTRALLSLRWDDENLVALCAGCHLWWHHEPLSAAAWFNERWPGRYDRLLLLRRTRRKTDLAALAVSLKVTAERLRS